MSRPKYSATIEIVDSHWIHFVKFDPDNLNLDVTTRTGAKHRYYHVGTDTFAKLVCSESSGAYFNAHIKGKFESRKLRKAD